MLRGIFSRLDVQFAVLVVIFAALRSASSATAFASYVLLALYALRGGRHVAESLLLTWFATMANPQIFPMVPLGSIAKLLPVVSGALVVTPKILSLRLDRWKLTTFLLAIFLIFHSFLISTFPIVSTLKAATWALVIVSLIISLSGVSWSSFRIFENNLYLILAGVAALSLAAYFSSPAGQMPRVGFMRGILSHSQALGPMATVLGLLAFGRLIENPRRLLTNGLIMTISLLCIYFSASRVAMVSLVLTMIAMAMLGLAKQSQDRERIVYLFSRPASITAIILFVGFLLVSGPSVLDLSEDFLAKRSDAEDLASAYYASRGGLATVMWDNVVANPLFGIGFGVASHPSLMDVQTIFGIPVGAAVEKGITPLAVTEELGIPGFFVFLMWVLVGFTSSFRSDVLSFGILLGVVLLNFGEATLFSPGGAGLLQIVLIGWIICRSSMHRARNQPARKRRLNNISSPQLRVRHS